MYKIIIFLIGLVALVRGQTTCGVPEPGFEFSERIIGGKPVTPNAWPWMLAIETDDGSEFRLHCGGVIISENWALTAAHCITLQPIGAELLAIAGLYNRSQVFDNTQIRYLEPSDITVHPGFQNDTLQHDIAIVHFSTPLDFSGPRVRPICLPPTSDTSYVENPNCYLAGWGITTPNTDLSETLLRISTDVIDPLHCQLRFPRPIMPQETCTFDEVTRSQTPCDGDMGGALGCVYDAKFYVAGVMSFTRGCNPLEAQISANIPFYLDWIRNVTGIPPPL